MIGRSSAHDIAGDISGRLGAVILTTFLMAGLTLAGAGCSKRQAAPPRNLRAVVVPPPAPLTPLMTTFGLARLRLSWDPSPDLTGDDNSGGRYLIRKVSDERLDVREVVAEVPASEHGAWVPLAYPIGATPPLYEVVAETADGAKSPPAASGLVAPLPYLHGLALSHPQGAPTCLPSAEATVIALDAVGGLWLGFSGAGLAYRAADSDAWQRWTSVDGLLDDSVRAITIDRDGHAWVATVRGLHEIDRDNGVLRTWATGSGDLSGRIGGLTFDDSGALWIAAGGALWRMSPGGSHPLRLDGTETTGTAPALFHDLLGSMERRAWQNHLKRVPTAGSAIRTIVRAPDGALWVTGPAGGLLRHRPTGSDWQFLGAPLSGTLTKPVVEAVAPEAGDFGWVATSEGLEHLSPDRTWNAVRMPAELAGQPLEGMSLCRSGVLAAIVDGHALICRARDLTCEPLDGVPSGKNTAYGWSAVTCNPSGDVWLASRDGRLARRERHRLVTIPLDKPCSTAPPADDLTAIVRADEDTIWIANPTAVARRAPTTGAWRVFHSGQTSTPGMSERPQPIRSGVDLPIVGVSALAMDTEGNIYAAGTSEMAVYSPSPDVWTIARLDGPPIPKRSRALTLTTVGTVLVGGTNGLLAVDIRSGRSRSIAKAGGSAPPIVTALAPGAFGGAWVGTASGLRGWRPGSAELVLPTRLAHDGAVDALRAVESGVWVAIGIEVTRLQDVLGAAITVRLPVEWTGDRVVGLDVTPEGVAVIATRSGRIACVDPESAEAQEQPNLSAPDGVEVRGLLVDEGYTTWIATRGLGLVAMPSLCRR